MGLELEEEVVGLRRRGQAAGCIQNGAVDDGFHMCLIWVYGFNIVLWVLYGFVG